MVGDVDNDGYLDLVFAVVTFYKIDSQYCIPDEDSVLSITKVNLEKQLEQGSLPARKLEPKTSMTNAMLTDKGKKLLPLEKQTWTQYLGKKGDNKYT